MCSLPFLPPLRIALFEHRGLWSTCRNGGHPPSARPTNCWILSCLSPPPSGSPEETSPAALLLLWQPWSPDWLIDSRLNGIGSAQTLTLQDRYLLAEVGQLFQGVRRSPQSLHEALVETNGGNTSLQPLALIGNFNQTLDQVERLRQHAV